MHPIVTERTLGSAHLPVIHHPTGLEGVDYLVSEEAALPNGDSLWTGF
ncbi:MAG TPA: hypothetical protein VKB88_41240 [Bryobacteraceae bacterium]|nr:hypothetical protein [Bryobacteraceae bacterium]